MLVSFFRVQQKRDAQDDTVGADGSTLSKYDAIDQRKRQMLEDLNAFKRVEPPQYYLLFFQRCYEPKRAKTVRRMMQKSQSRIKKELDLQKFIHR